ncbi:23S rRNA (guanosine(2251)-2'-O)-methyltransferase RlmB [Poseidonibacter lekithochrous]|uniref:23S rRNA (guanosine(2251)-2'-O)-methyltransferase RlmB n=1 Tax=Poseidonibacter TaxID=2321187 RepID=UPI001C0A182A|nr:MULTISPECIES: 23S rRNA (guanosine(2251)-2'-O)-methyltransferase RlmB [Poseidonibacter]MBU3014336.1 23S rRNA (guanosine(2251)-2'-O)-methyltransferase RlmB [Poseidonibacter lekithochrous]MDO6827634.1 23S rRNA (guanosine(2251)-2'-O)-methyltransferase RlmB [Poseidonibacter sp. 1_MG-2023]
MIIYGKQIVLYVLENHPELIEEVFLSKEIDKKLFSKFASLKKVIYKVDNQKAQALAKGGNHQGFFLKLVQFDYTPIKDFKEMNFILVLDGVTDVGNIGAIARTAYSMGIEGIIASNIKTINNAGIVRTSSGALLDLPFMVHPRSADLSSELRDCGFTLIGATTDGVDLKKYGKIEKTDKVALFLGSEGEGISPKVAKKLDLKVSIAMEHEFDSLNVSVAAGILIYNLKR